MVVFIGNTGIPKMMAIGLSDAIHIGRDIRDAPIKKDNWAFQGIGLPELLDPAL